MELIDSSMSDSRQTSSPQTSDLGFAGFLPLYLLVCRIPLIGGTDLADDLDDMGWSHSW